MTQTRTTGIDVGEESRIILQSLLCLLREKNILSRADIEDLKHRVEMRATGSSGDSLPCCPEAALAAVEDMKQMNSYLGQRYGGKHARHLS
jgi:hypothetical protein